MEILSKVLQSVFEIILPAAAVWFIAWLRGQLAPVMDNLKAEHPDLYGMTRRIADTVVMAAEQIYSNGKGAEKKQYAIGAMESLLNAQGIALDLQTIDAMIEASVFDNLNRWKTYEPKSVPETKEAE